MEKLDTNVHHLIPKSKNGITTPRNTLIMDVKEHARLHAYFGNDTPVEQICRVLLLNEKIFTDHFKQDLLDTLDRYINNYYEKKTHNWFIKSEVERVLNLEDTII